MDVEKLIQAAEYCAIEAHETCQDCPMYDDCPADDRDPVDIALRILAIRDHVRAEGRAEGRADVIAQVRGHLHRIKTYECLDKYLAIEIQRLSDKLDELAGEER